MNVRNALNLLLVRFMKLRKEAYLNDKHADFDRYTELAKEVELMLGR